jgi:SNF2 family DNA or RNA helicase
MEPRTGKTKVAVDAMSVMHGMGRVDRVLVTCPISAIGVWIQEIEANCPYPYRIVVWDRRGRKTTSLPPWGIKRLVFVLINDDAFSVAGAIIRKQVRNRRTGEMETRVTRSTRRGGRYEVKKAFLKWMPQAIILDESHRYKKPSANRWHIMESLAKHADYRMILTGTVLTKKKRSHDIYAQWKILNPQSPLVVDHTLASFKAEYGLWRNRGNYDLFIRNRNEDKLRKLLHAESFAVRRDECFDLPPRTDQIIKVQLTGHGAEVYDRMAEDMVARIETGEITEALIKLVQVLRLAQITGGVAKTAESDEYPEGRLVRVGRDKLRVLEERLSDLFEADEKVVIGARFVADLIAIVKVCRKLKVPAFELHGRIKSREERDENIRKFGKHDGAAAFVMQPQAGALGIDLSAASIFIWFSLPGGDWVNFTQSEDRVALSPKPTFFEYLIAEGTVDEVLLETLQQDGDYAKKIMESPQRLLRNFKDARTR